MWIDIITLARLETRRLKHEVGYWLRLLGFESSDSRLYQTYIAAFWLFWVFTMWGFVIEQVERISRQITIQDASALLDAFPGFVLILQLIYFIALLFDPPLKLIAPDLSYTAASPVSRGAITIVHFIRALLAPAAALALVGTLAALFFAWSLTTANVGVRGFQAFFLTFALVYLSGALAWMGALTRQNYRASRRYALGIGLLAVLVGVQVFPGVFLWPGHFLTVLVRDSVHVHNIILLLAGLTATFVGLYSAGNRTHMTQVMDDSQVYARIQKLGIWGWVTAPDVVARIRRQSRLAQKSQFRRQLPETFNVTRTLFGQNSLVLVRLSPGLSLRLIAAGMTFASFSMSLVLMGGLSSVQTWVLLLVFLVRFRPDDVMRLFWAHVQRPFLRQFLPENNLLLFASQTLLPLLLMGVGVSLAVFVQPWVKPVAVLPLAIGVLFTLALSQALETVRFRRYALPGFDYEYAVILFGLLIIVPGYVLHSVWAALAATVLVDFLLALLLYHSTSA